MAELKAAQRERIPAKKFGLPDQRKYPMPDKAHARNAKARASEQYRRGELSKSEYDQINRKADLMLYGGHHRGHGHVYMVDDSGRGAPRTRVAPDSQPDYKIKPEGRRRGTTKPSVKRT